MGLWLWLWGYHYGSAYGKDLQTWRKPSPWGGSRGGGKPHQGRGRGRERRQGWNLTKDTPGVRSLGRLVGDWEPLFTDSILALNLGLVLSDIALSQELLEVSLIDKIKLKVFITTMHTALPAFPYLSASI